MIALLVEHPKVRELQHGAKLLQAVVALKGLPWPTHGW
jgi:hypothetical protein